MELWQTMKFSACSCISWRIVGTNVLQHSTIMPLLFLTHLSTFLTVLFLCILRICLVAFYFCFIYCLKHICNNFYLKSCGCPLELHRTPTIRKVSFYFSESGKFSACVISLPSVEIQAEMVTIDEFLNLNLISTFCIFSCTFHYLHSLNVRMLPVFRLRCEPQLLFDLTLKRQF